jgi:hypothetical protein
MTFSEKVQKTLANLGWDKLKKAFTKEETSTFVAKYSDDHESDFGTDLKAAQDAEAQAKADKEALDAAQAALQTITANSDDNNDGTQTITNDNADSNIDDVSANADANNNQDVDVAAAIKKLGETNAELTKELATAKKDITTLSGKLENDDPKKVTMNLEGFSQVHTATHAFGINAPMFSVEKRWNKIAVNPLWGKTTLPTEEDEAAFKAEVNSYGKKLSARFATLKENNMLNAEQLLASTTVTFNNVDGAADAWITRRMDGLIAQILQIKKIDLFPTRYGIQDMEVIDNVLFDEVLQPWQAGKTFKGGVEIQPETGHVDDGTIKLQFEPMVEIERKYDGYLNTDASDPIKWGLIEWFTRGILLQAIKDQTRCTVKGLFVKPETDVPGKAINTSTGALFNLIRLAHQYKMKLVDDATYSTYDNTTMYATVTAFLSAINDVLGDDELENYVLVLNSKHKMWWIQGVRDELGKDTDFAKGDGLNTIPDFDIPIYWMPAMGNLTWMFLEEPGNIQSLENKPGEMLALKFGEDFENVTVRSRFKKGISPAFVGKKFATKALLDANNYVNQRIFMNKPAITLAADATTATATTANFWFVTAANTAATAITDITSAVEGQPYIIECGSLTNATTIAKADKFVNLTAAWTPTAVGDYLMVVINNAGTAFRELERCVGGVRTVNSATQPTLPEARS